MMFFCDDDVKQVPNRHNDLCSVMMMLFCDDDVQQVPTGYIQLYTMIFVIIMFWLSYVLISLMKMFGRCQLDTMLFAKLCVKLC